MFTLDYCPSCGHTFYNMDEGNGWYLFRGSCRIYVAVVLNGGKGGGVNEGWMS